MNKIETHDTMNPEQQDIAIFESLGWKYLPPVKRDSSFIVRPENLPRWKKGREIAYKDDIPSYGTDLNACREFEEKLIALGPPALDTYEIFLSAICTRAGNRIFRATAAQRCEAFLKTINKWTNDN